MKIFLLYIFSYIESYYSKHTHLYKANNIILFALHLTMTLISSSSKSSFSLTSKHHLYY